MAESPLIAIVDDEEAICDALTSLLRSVGWRAEAFTSAEAFLQSGQVHTTACLLLDVRLPGRSGLELVAGAGREQRGGQGGEGRGQGDHAASIGAAPQDASPR